MTTEYNQRGRAAPGGFIIPMAQLALLQGRMKTGTDLGSLPRTPFY